MYSENGAGSLKEDAGVMQIDCRSNLFLFIVGTAVPLEEKAKESIWIATGTVERVQKWTINQVEL
jgi:hypothetical protein